MREVTSSSAKKEQLTRLSYEPESPGIGGPPTGSILKRYTNAILKGLETELQEQPVNMRSENELTMPEIEWDAMALNNHIKDMDSVSFWQQKGL